MIFNTDLFEIYFPPFVLITLGSLFSLLITFFGIPSIVRIARVKELVDIPNGRTSHNLPIPNMGGVAVFAGVILSSVLFTGLSTAHEFKYIIAGMIIIFFIGVKDDLVDLVPYKKLIGQLFATFFIVVPGDIRITAFHGLFGVGDITYIPSVIVTFILIITLINSFNLIDGIDGLASGIGIITSLTFGLWFIFSGHFSYAVISFALIGSLIAFFRFNVFSKKNKIFLGDTGSMIIGLLLAVFAIRFLEFETDAVGITEIEFAPAMLLCILIVPLFDTVRVFFVRIFRGKSPFVADRNHIHHRLLDLSSSHLKATLIILFVNILFILFGFFFGALGNELLIVIVLLLAAFFSYIPIYLMNKRMRALLKEVV